MWHHKPSNVTSIHAAPSRILHGIFMNPPHRDSVKRSTTWRTKKWGKLGVYLAYTDSDRIKYVRWHQDLFHVSWWWFVMIHSLGCFQKGVPLFLETPIICFPGSLSYLHDSFDDIFSSLIWAFFCLLWASSTHLATSNLRSTTLKTNKGPENGGPFSEEIPLGNPNDVQVPS